MQKKRIPSSHLLVALLGLCASWSAGAIGFGQATPSTVLGRPLEFRVVVRLDAGETLDPACVRATVAVGDAVVPGAGVGTLVTTGPDDTAVVRVRTLMRIDEPLVSVQVEAGCTQRIARRYTVFADPPATVVAVEAAALPDDRGAALPSPAPATDLPREAVPQRVVTAEPAPSRADNIPAPAKATPRPRKPRRSDTAPIGERPAPRARLRLDAPAEAPPPAPPVLSEEGLALVDQANEAVKAAIAAASASQQRIAALEDSVRQLTTAAVEQRELVELLRQQADRNDGNGRWTWPLAMVVLILAGLAAWLWTRLRDLERERQRGWLAAAQAGSSPQASPVPPPPSQVPMLVERGGRNANAGVLGAGLAPVHQPTPSELPDPTPTQPQAVPPWDEPAEPRMQQTQPLVAGNFPAGAETESRDVSAEELIDLEQQAEFFVVLGQDESAIELLVAHLRDSGGASPLPYLKLLDIYRRLGDHEAYERTRDRFNQRFNAHAPSWDASGGDGRGLEDYPGVIRWIQRVWPKPLDAMAELESLLFRRDGGELFELAAYRELLLLYGLARDLLDTEPGGGGAVDVLLPLNDAPGFAPTSPRPYFGDDAPPMPDGQPTAPLDLDLGPNDHRQH
jgi:pilus assembly protein FimV